MLRISEVLSAELNAEMGTIKSVFWDDLARDLEDPEFLREYLCHGQQSSISNLLLSASTSTLSDIGHTFGKQDEPHLPEVLHQEPSNLGRVVHAQELGWDDKAHSPTAFEELCSVHGECCPG